jgi:translocator protein
MSRSGPRAGDCRLVPQTRALHLAQLTLNAIWPMAFFDIGDKSASLIIIALLDDTLTAELALLGGEDRVAAVLLMPYLAWSGFATALNAAVSDPGQQG